MIPVFELRGAIIAGAAEQLPWYNVFIVSVIGNMIPIPFILLFIRKILHTMKNLPFLNKIAERIEKKGEKHKDKLLKGTFIGLILFVGIPLPGTGAWTGALVAALVNMRMKKALPSIFAGVLIAAVIMTLASYGSVSVFSFLIK